ncbi:MAG: phage holin family protein [Nitriliruptoraceae bacterium]
MSSTPSPGGAEAPNESDDRDTTEVLASLIAGGQGLIKTEFELAKLELQRIVKEKAMALGLVLGGAVLALFILGFVGVTAAQALILVVEPWLAWLIVTAAYTLLAVVLFLVAVRLFKRSVAPERTKAELERTRSWASEQAGR